VGTCARIEHGVQSAETDEAWVPVNCVGLHCWGALLEQQHDVTYHLRMENLHPECGQAVIKRQSA
jgi:hypothetical protein